MIQVNLIRHCRSKEQFESLTGFLKALGVQHQDEDQWPGVEFTPELSWTVRPEKDESDEIFISVNDPDTALRIAKDRGLKVSRVQRSDHPGYDALAFIVELPGGLKIDVAGLLQPIAKHYKATVGQLASSSSRIGIIVSRFNSFITERLLDAAMDALRRTGSDLSHVQIVRVPGAFEIPSAARILAETGTVDAIICLGCLLRGETANYEQICAEVTRGVGQSAQETGVPHAWGVLTCDTLEQAIDRAGLKSGNKGFEAALAAIEMASLGKVLSTQYSVLSNSAHKITKQQKSKHRNKKKQ